VHLKLNIKDKIKEKMTGRAADPKIKIKFRIKELKIK
jgi:hypothetical protein